MNSRQYFKGFHLIKSDFFGALGVIEGSKKDPDVSKGSFGVICMWKQAHICRLFPLYIIYSCYQI